MHLTGRGAVWVERIPKERCGNSTAGERHPPGRAAWNASAGVFDTLTGVKSGERTADVQKIWSRFFLDFGVKVFWGTKM